MLRVHLQGDQVRRITTLCTSNVVGVELEMSAARQYLRAQFPDTIVKCALVIEA